VTRSQSALCFCSLVLLARATAAPPTFLTSTLYPMPGSNPANTTGPLALDLNGDGRVDLLFVDPIAANILAELGNGNGTFQAPVSSAVPAAFVSGNIISGDFNGDGRLDLLLYTLTSLQIMFGNGDGTFVPGPTPTISFPPNLESFLLYPANFNHDGATDLFVFGSTKVSTPNFSFGVPFSFLVLNNGDGTFGSPMPSGIQYQPETPTTLVLTADVNNDGLDDVIIYSGFGFGITGIELSTGNGTFAPSLKPLPNGSTFQYLLAADFNHDGKTDLLGATANGNNGSMSVLLGNGDGTFNIAGTTPFSLNGGFVADVNGDGLLDLVQYNSFASSTVAIALGSTDFTFQKPSAFSTLGSIASVVDVNADGKADVIVTGSQGPYNLPGQYTIMFGQATAVLRAPKFSAVAGSSPDYAAVIGDFDGDGKPDLVAGGAALCLTCQDLFFLKGNGDGTFGPTVSLPVTGTVWNLVSADFNRDGKPDVAVLSSAFNGAGYQYSLSILLSNGDGTFQQPLSAPFPVTTGANFYTGPMKTGDFNRDGIPDFFVMCVTDGVPNLYVLLGNGDGTFQPVNNLLDTATNGYHAPLDAALLDANGDLILFWALALNDPNQNHAEILLSKGDGTFQSGGSYYPQVFGDPGPAAVAVGDVNGDGIPDLVVLDSFVAQPVTLAVLLGTGSHGFAAPVYIPLSFREGIAVALADMNGDGNLDIVLGNEVLTGNGDGTFQPGIFLGGGYYYASVISGIVNGDLTIADVNGDGKPDVLINTGTSAGIEAILNATPAPTCAANTGGQISVLSGGFQFNHATQSFVQKVTLTNNGQQAVAGPIVLVLDGLSSTATLRGANGVTQCNSPLGSPWIEVAAGALAAGQSDSVSLTFYDPTETTIHYTSRVLNGGGQP
jgi:hypothetical protein